MIRSNSENHWPATSLLHRSMEFVRFHSGLRFHNGDSATGCPDKLSYQPDSFEGSQSVPDWEDTQTNKG